MSSTWTHEMPLSLCALVQSLGAAVPERSPLRPVGGKVFVDHNVIEISAAGTRRQSRATSGEREGIAVDETALDEVARAFRNRDGEMKGGRFASPLPLSASW